MANITNVITRLLLKTNNGTYTWEQQSEDRFDLTLNTAILRLHKDSDTSYRLSVCNTRGRLVKRVQSNALDQEAQDLLEELYNTVDSAFSEHNTTLNLLLDELNE